ncbi:MAG: ribonuclease HI [Rickettsiales bacterium]|jgi:ribonuclease HI|nr:ribonuclease HI [Rickettsiales bacterium]
MSNKITIYTDGSCFGNPGKGGWGAILLYEGLRKDLCGNEEYTTNNKMELQAVIEALKAIKNNYEIDLYTDSNYVKNGITEWIFKWKKNGWKTTSKLAVKNKEQWQELDNLVEKFKINWFWVKGHAGNEMNEEVDKLARKGIIQ